MLKTLIELQRLKKLERTGWTLRGQANGTESVAAHSFGVCAAAMLMADAMISRGVQLDMERILRMALLHDWAETRVGDMPRTATSYFNADVRTQAELAAFSDIVNNAGAAASKYYGLFEDYEQRGSLEARVVKAADVIDLLVQALAMERAGARGLDEFWEVAENGEFNLDGDAHAVVSEVLHALLAARDGNHT